MDKKRAVLEYFLSQDIRDVEAVLQIFEKLKGAVRGVSQVGYPYVYIPGKKKNKVLLTAHADTVWQGIEVARQKILNSQGFYFSENPEVGIGADDRAGCAMLYLLRNTGHSMLITTGEEEDMLCSCYLSKEEYELFNDHNFIVQLDKCGSREFKCYNVGNEEFIGYIKKRTHFKYINPSSFTDIVNLCKTICGVNFAIGYHSQHSGAEVLSYKEWLDTLKAVKKLIKNTQKFPLEKKRGIFENDNDNNPICFDPLNIIGECNIEDLEDYDEFEE